MITCLSLDEEHSKLWYGTPHSTIYCLDIAKKPSAGVYFDLPGM